MIKSQYIILIGLILVLADLWPFNKKYLNNNDFERVRKNQTEIPKSKADEFILNDKDPNYKVLNIGVNPFSDGFTSYYHKSLGGYHGAKLKRYQELIERGISPEMLKMQQGFKNIKSQADIDSIFSDLDVLNMLNTKYIIYNPNAQPLVNNKALGNAWFASKIRFVANADEEIAAISNFNAKNEAIIDNRYLHHFEGKNLSKDSTAMVKLTSYAPNKLEYQYKSSKEQLLIFSEIYYPAGWTAKIDGEEIPHFHANYLLRAMVVPSGSHNIIFEFKPKTYYAGNKVSLISSIILLLILAGAVMYEIKKSKAIPE